MLRDLENDVEKKMKLLAVAGSMIILYFISMILTSQIVVLLADSTTAIPKEDFFLGIFINASVWSIAGLILFQKMPYKKPQSSSLQKKLHLYFAGFIGCLATAVFFNYLFQLFDYKPDMQGVAKDIASIPRESLYLAFIGPALMIPLVEEVLFRGFLYTALKEQMNTTQAILLTSLFFAAVHMEVHVFPQLFILGIIFNVIYEKTGSLAVCTAIHATNNGLAILGLFLNPQVQV